ncbi:hypothetical protein C8A05DRAFT_30886 [Staphylotrichum tortipilum]|uniref:Uncharacterized protein n=1 Tax=Staphylotrichum tortipilum TaxID=2831512 RepID=A0AAN6MQN2_9PEZI|nr:hypothetical protein C8A05DRAFT_30886 [Staphylotrichum longicolle]
MEQLGLLQQWKRAQQVRLVDMDDIQLVDFREIDAIGTDGLGGCSVRSPPAQPARAPAHKDDLLAGDRNVWRVMGEIQNLYYQNLASFPASSTHIVYASYKGEMALPDQVAIMQQAFAGMGFPASALHSYIVPPNRSAPGHGTVLVTRPTISGQQPTVFVQDVWVSGQPPRPAPPPVFSAQGQGGVNIGLRGSRPGLGIRLKPKSRPALDTGPAVQTSNPDEDKPTPSARPRTGRPAVPLLNPRPAVQLLTPQVRAETITLTAIGLPIAARPSNPSNTPRLPDRLIRTITTATTTTPRPLLDTKSQRTSWRRARYSNGRPAQVYTVTQALYYTFQDIV